ncbi:MAG: hypothetical protein JO235_19730 [Chroococcidiopsidaceae cyanobacterium CP_BM_RX_35]|nr:hypothetical protein [Chroococcidiopsidaceae cyanobacterium CP_BM_RX_35]
MTQPLSHLLHNWDQTRRVSQPVIMWIVKQNSQVTIEVFYLTLNLEEQLDVVASSELSFEPIKMLGQMNT